MSGHPATGSGCLLPAAPLPSSPRAPYVPTSIAVPPAASAAPCCCPILLPRQSSSDQPPSGPALAREVQGSQPRACAACAARCEAPLRVLLLLTTPSCCCVRLLAPPSQPSLISSSPAWSRVPHFPVHVLLPFPAEGRPGAAGCRPAAAAAELHRQRRLLPSAAAGGIGVGEDCALCSRCQYVYLALLQAGVGGPHSPSSARELLS